MALHLCRTDSRFFIWIVIMLNVVLAFYNFVSLHIDSGNPRPCIVIVQSNASVPNANPVPLSVTPAAMVQKPQRVVTETVKQLKTIPLTQKLPKSSADETTKQQLAASVVSKTNGSSSKWDTEVRGKFLVIRNYIPADSRPPSPKQSVTLTTQGTFEFLHHVVQLCQRWDGPLSVAVYAPGEDFKAAVDEVLHMRQCSDVCVSKNVSWHFIYDQEHGQKPSELIPPELLARNESLNCSMPWKPMASNYRSEHKLPYPINVLRNVARLQARTHYVLPSDIELYPSVNMASMFVKFIENDAKSGGRHVYAIPIFEVQAGLQVPTNKSELTELVNKGKAIFFHKWVCDACQRFPGRDEWLKQVPKKDTIGVFKVTKRTRGLGSWEPIYIGTNDEPLYDERLTWEGKRDKMSQMFELCLMDYDVCILDNAFLVHAPGIKHLNPQDQKRRMPYIRKNNAVYSEILATLRKKHPGSKNVC